MEGVNGADDLEAAFLVSKLARQFEQAFVGFTATIAEKALARTNQACQRLGQAALWLMVVEVGRVNELARLFDQCLGNGRMRVAQRAHSDSAPQIQVAFTRHVINIAP